MRPFDIPDIRARELLTVIALSEYGSFVAAAAYLKTSQPALTRTVKRLERVLGVTLFFRNTRRVDNAVNAAKAFQNLCNNPLHLFDVGDIRRDRENLSAEALQFHDLS